MHILLLDFLLACGPMVQARLVDWLDWASLHKKSYCGFYMWLVHRGLTVMFVYFTELHCKLTYPPTIGGIISEGHFHGYCYCFFSFFLLPCSLFLSMWPQSVAAITCHLIRLTMSHSPHWHLASLWQPFSQSQSSANDGNSILLAFKYVKWGWGLRWCELYRKTKIPTCDGRWRTVSMLWWGRHNLEWALNINGSHNFCH